MNFSRLLKITSAVAVVMAAGTSAQSYAETTKTVEKEAAMASTTQNTALKFAAEELLGHVSEAQIALTYDKLDVAGHHIDKALEVATSLRGAAPGQPLQQGVRLRGGASVAARGARHADGGGEVRRKSHELQRLPHVAAHAREGR